MTFERYTDRLRKVMALARDEAYKKGRGEVTPEHILLGLVKQGGTGVGGTVLKNLGFDLNAIGKSIERKVEGTEQSFTSVTPPSLEARKVLEYAVETARSWNHNYIGTEHLLAGLMRAEDSVAGQVLRNEFGLELDKYRQEVLEILGLTDNGSSHEEQEKQRARSEGFDDGVDYYAQLNNLTNCTVRILDDLARIKSHGANIQGISEMSDTYKSAIDYSEAQLKLLKEKYEERVDGCSSSLTCARQAHKELTDKIAEIEAGQRK